MRRDRVANALYDFGRQGFLEGTIDWDTDTIKIILIDAADYTKDLVNHDNLNDVPVAAGVADANNVTWSAVSGDQSEQIIGYKDSGVESTSRLIFNIDTATGLPVTPNGGDITVQWDDGANKIFKL